MKTKQRRTSLITFFILLITIFGCKQSSKELNTSSQKKEIVEVENKADIDFQSDLKNKPKLFSDFWYDMSEQDFNKVADLLIKEKKLKGNSPNHLTYITNKCSSILKPEFKNNLLKKIKLENGECLYPLYQEKYNLPHFIQKNYIDAVYIENNPNYSPIKTYIDNDGVHNLPSVFIDKNNTLLSPGEKIYLDTDNLKSIKVDLLPESPMIIERANSVIIIEQEIIDNPFPLISYSLSETKEMKVYQKSKGVLYNHFDKESQYISTNSKLRKIEKGSEAIIKIVYMSKTDYNDKLLKELNKKQNDLIEKANRKKENKERKKSNLEDI